MSKIKSPKTRETRKKQREPYRHPNLDNTTDSEEIENIIEYVPRCSECGYDLSESPHRQMCGRKGIHCDRLGGSTCEDCGSFTRDEDIHDCVGGPCYNRCIECGFILGETNYNDFCGSYKCKKKGGYFCKRKLEGGEECEIFVKDGEKPCCLF